MKFKHMHPITIWNFLSRFSFLLILPVVQALLARPRGWILFSNLLVLLLFVALAIFQYFSCGYHIGDREFTYKSGIILRKSQSIPTQNFLSAIVRLNPLLSIVGAAQLYLDTPAGRKKNADIMMVLHKKGLLNLWNSMTVHHRQVYRASNKRILIMAAAWSNPATGLLLVGALLNRAGKIVGRELTERLYAAVNQSYVLVAFGIPPATALLGYLLAAGWAVALIYQFLRYAIFSVGTVSANDHAPVYIRSEEDFITVTRGLFIKNKQLLSRDAICAVSIQQTLIMRLLKLYSSYLHTIGSGKEKGDRSMLFAAIHKPELRQYMAAIFRKNLFSTNGCKNVTHPTKSALVSFLFTPLLFLFCVLALIGVLYWFYPEFAPLLFFFLPPILWQLAIHFYAWKSSMLLVEEDRILVSGYRNLTLYTACIPREQSQRISVQQNFIQRFSGRCTLRVCTGAEKTGCFVVNNLDKDEVLKLLEMQYKSPRKA
jgi:uncharacterized membrane protein YdbT with pleckstrin-like domain